MQVEHRWEERHAKILHEYLVLLNDEKVPYFILRNYEGLPENNTSKDIDLIIEPGKYKKASALLLRVFQNNQVPNYYVSKFERAHCWIGIDLEFDFYIHIDLIEGYLNKGFEVFDFKTLYANTIQYKEYTVLNDVYNAVMLLLYKVIGCKELKEKYRKEISRINQGNRIEIQKVLTSIFDKALVAQLCERLAKNDYEWIIRSARRLSWKSKKKAIIKRPLYTLKNITAFIIEKVDRILICRPKYRKMIAVEAPDGAGKTTFIDLLAVKLAECFVAEPTKVHVYHFRPTLFPNLGEIGEKVGVMEQDKDFTNPHRGKKTGFISSIFRMMYYTMDYIMGGFLCIRKDAQFDKFMIFDRYIYDFVVDPKRSKINLPLGVRMFFCKIVPQPQLTFVLNADAAVIYNRKQELTLEEIKRQLKEFDNLRDVARGFNRLDANQSPDEIVKVALEIIINRYTLRTNDIEKEMI